MPEARQAPHRQGVDFHLALTADDREVWVAAMRAASRPGPRAPRHPVLRLRPPSRGLPLADEIAAGPDEHLQGASLIADPGNLLAGPVSGARRSSTPMRPGATTRPAVSDTGGHYSRPDIVPS
jgi:nitrilase